MYELSTIIFFSVDKTDNKIAMKKIPSSSHAHFAEYKKLLGPGDKLPDLEPVVYAGS